MCEENRLRYLWFTPVPLVAVPLVLLLVSNRVQLLTHITWRGVLTVTGARPPPQHRREQASLIGVW